MSMQQIGSNNQPNLNGAALVCATLVLAMANFVAVLNMTIANVVVPNIAGALGASSNQATWIITSYAAAEAITVPLTGWLSRRFGEVRIFVLSVIFFGIFSLCCGMSTSLTMLIIMRVFQGIAGGPILALSQTLLLRIFPKERAMEATGWWGMATLLAPVIGPVLGGWLADEYSWPLVFFINMPLTLLFGFSAWVILKNHESTTEKHSIDMVGMILLIIWVAALQIMLDEGKDLDWFSSNKICVLAIVSIVGFASFVIWELTEKHPIVDLRIFRYRGFSGSMIALALSMGAFFAANVLTPLWLQYNMSYTATWAGLVVAHGGILSVVFSPIAAVIAKKIDPRLLVFISIFLMGVITFWRSIATLDMTWQQICIPLFFLGAGLPSFFVPLSGIAMGSVNENEMASASGLLNFIRTIAGAFGTSLVTTAWQDKAIYAHAELTNIVDIPNDVIQLLTSVNLSPELQANILNLLVTGQSVLLSTNGLMVTLGIIYVIASLPIFIAPRPIREVGMISIGH